MNKKNLKILCIILLGLILIVYLSFKIDFFVRDFSLKKGVVQNDLIQKIFGEYRVLLAQVAMIKADEYFHGGLRNPIVKEGLIQELSLLSGVEYKAKEKYHVHADAHGEPQNKKHFKINKAPKNISHFNILPYLAATMQIGGHVHLGKDESPEAVPWYIYASKLNPKDPGIFALGGYWIGRAITQPDKGIAFLLEGLRHNPGSWEIANEIAMIYLVEKKDMELALAYSLMALKFLEKPESDEYERFKALSMAAYCYEELGKTKEAVIFREKVKKIQELKALRVHKKYQESVE